MALTQRSIGKSRHRMILLVLTAITLLSLDLSSFGPLGTAQRLVRDLLHPITEVAGVLKPMAHHTHPNQCASRKIVSNTRKIPNSFACT